MRIGFSPSRAGRSLLRFLSPALALIAAPAAAQEKSFESVWGTSSVAEACSTLDQLNLDKIDKAPLNASDIDGFHRRVRGSEPEPADAPLVVKIGVSGGMTSNGIGGPESIVAVQAKPGLWHVSRVLRARPSWTIYEVMGAPLPSDADEPGGIISEADYYRTIVEGVLAPASAAALEAAIAAPCLAKEPPSLPLVLPLKGGGQHYCPPDSAHWVVEINNARGTARYDRPCQLVGPVGKIVRILSSAGFAEVTRRFDPEKPYQADPSATAETARAFLARRLPSATLVREGSDVKARIASFASEGCTSTFTLAGPGGVAGETLVRHWKDLKTFQNKPHEGAVELSFGDGLERIELGSTIGAIKLYNSILYLSGSCQREGSGA